MNASDSRMNLHKLRRPSSDKENKSQPDSDQYWEAAVWHYNKDSAENQYMNHKIERLTALSCSRYHEQLGKSAFSRHFENSLACPSQLAANEDVFCCAGA